MRGAAAAALLLAMLPAGAMAADAPPRMVADIVFTGNSTISSAELLRIAGLRIGEPLGSEAIEDARQRIAAAYLGHGREIALRVMFTPVRGGQTAVQFIIDEHPPFPAASPARPGARPEQRGATPAQRGGARYGGVPPPPPPEERR